MSFIPTVGPTGGVKNRLNATDFVRDEKFFTLYIRALKAIQDRGQEDYKSFFQVSGIHGLPFTEWAKKQHSLKANKSGYCSHGSVIFPTWHRTYVSIYEQILQAAAVEIAAKFTVDKEAWVQAAQDLRQPYWDWGFQLVPPEELINKRDVAIVDYNGKKITVPNPILRYGFHPVDPSFNTGDPSFKLRNSRITVRNPNRNLQEDIPALINKMQLDADNTRDSTYKMLKDSDTWELFSNHGVGDESHANSLEAVHDHIHVIVGFGEERGHMTHPFWAAFDPIFWFHHSNVDRLLSLWQAMNPGVWVTPGRSGQTLAFNRGSTVDKNSPLEPFYQTTEDVWTSAPLTDTTKLGYSYPDFDDLVGADPDLIRDAINDLVDRRYGTKKSKGASNAALDLLSAFQGVTEEHSDELKMYDWAIHVSFKKFELDESFSLIFYFADDNGDYNKKDSYVGSIDAFRGSTPETCENCNDNQDLVQEGFVHLNRVLARTIQSFDPDQVVKFLKEKKLSYKLFTDESKPLTTLKLSVEGRPLHLPPGSNRPKVDRSQTPVVAEDIIGYVPLATPA